MQDLGSENCGTWLVIAFSWTIKVVECTKNNIMNKLFYIPDGGSGAACFLESPESTVELLDVSLCIAVGILWENKK